MARLGIISGWGAAAGVRMAQQLVELAQANGAEKDEDFPDFVLLNVPARGMDETGFKHADLIRIALRKAVKELAAMDCRYIAIACNTAHAFYEELDRHTHAEVLNMIQIAVNQTKGCKTVGVLCSESTRDLRLYDAALEELHIRPIFPDAMDQRAINVIISNVICGLEAPINDTGLLGIIERLVGNGAQRVIVGCTELSVPLPLRPHDVLVDAGRATMAKALSLL